MRLFIAFLVSCALPMIAFAQDAPPPDHAKLDAILGEVVRDESVDYDLLGRQHLLGLFNYLASLVHVDPARLAPDDRLAFYINLYNATVLHEVVQRLSKGPNWQADADDFALFKEPVVTIGARKLSLNDLEHKIIRPEFKDPRVHAALVCAARSCPPLLGRAYTGQTVQATLTRNMRRFLLDRTRNTIDDEKKELKLSKIFEWYADDFGGKDKLAGYVGDVLGKNLDEYAVSFVEYSWELNDVKR